MNRGYIHSALLWHVSQGPACLFASSWSDVLPGGASSFPSLFPCGIFWEGAASPRMAQLALWDSCFWLLAHQLFLLLLWGQSFFFFLLFFSDDSCSTSFLVCPELWPTVPRCSCSAVPTSMTPGPWSVQHAVSPLAQSLLLLFLLGLQMCWGLCTVNLSPQAHFWKVCF